jgi:hypothetical protein
MSPYRDALGKEPDVKPRIGVLVRLWRWLFGDPYPRRLLPKQCATPGRAGEARLNERCAGIADPRCIAGNCTMHCKEFCGDRCAKGEA